MKNVQIPINLFLDIIDYLAGEGISKENLEAQLYKKLDALIAHEYYTKYKKSPPGEDREKLRKNYLKLARIPENYLTDKETPYKEI